MLFLLHALTALQGVRASCECGYKTNTNEVWQFRIVTNFSSAINATDGFNANWKIIDKIQGDITDSTPYQINYTTANVNVPTTASSDGELTMLVSAYNDTAETAIPSGQISTLRSDILFGSFRANYAVTGGAGACAAFFSYADDTNENDVEILTKDGNDEVHFTNQGTDISNSTVTVALPNDELTTDFQTYRFDWTSDAVKYYINDIFMTNITNNPSQEAGVIYLSAWSNGGTFTEGPPTEEVQMAVTSITLYFNSSDASVVSAYDSACAQAASSTSICTVDSDSITYTSNATSSARPSASATSRSVLSSSNSSQLTSSRALMILTTMFVVAVSCFL